MAKYRPLTEALQAAAARGQETLDLGFDEIEEIIGHRLPPSSHQRQWWANSSHSQALAWRAAGFHVDQVYLDRRQVRFVMGRVGGTHHDGRRAPIAPQAAQSTASREPTPDGQPVDVRVTLRWLASGEVMLDADGKLAFGPVDAVPGLYRIALAEGRTGTRPRVYVGESDNLRRRLSANYRNPGPRQQTSLRINALLREHLAAGGDVCLAVATAATVWLNGHEQTLDLTSRAGRLLAENAALVLARATDDADIVNLG